MTVTRFIRQVVTPAPYPISATAAVTRAVFEMLKTAPWVETPGQSGGRYPAHTALQPATLDPGWDAFNICCAYAAGEQHIMAGYAAYRFDLPAAAKSTGCRITALALRAVADKYNTTGARVTAFISDDPAPLACGLQIRAGGFAALGGLMQTENPASPDDKTRPSTHKSELLALDSETPPAAAKYLWLYLTLEDYTAYRGNWVEGGAALLADTLQITYDKAPAADTYGIFPAVLPLGPGPAVFRAVGHLFATHSANKLAWLDNGVWRDLTLPLTTPALTHLANGILTAAPVAEGGPLALIRVAAGRPPTLAVLANEHPFTQIAFFGDVGDGDLLLQARIPDISEDVLFTFQIVKNEVFQMQGEENSGGVAPLLALNPDGSRQVYLCRDNAWGGALRKRNGGFFDFAGTTNFRHTDEAHSVFDIDTLQPCGVWNPSGDIGVSDMPNDFFAQQQTPGGNEWFKPPRVVPPPDHTISSVYFSYEQRRFFFWCERNGDPSSGHCNSSLFSLAADHPNTLVDGRRSYELTQSDRVVIPFAIDGADTSGTKGMLFVTQAPGMLVFWSLVLARANPSAGVWSKITTWQPDGTTRQITDAEANGPVFTPYGIAGRMSPFAANPATVGGHAALLLDLLYSPFPSIETGAIRFSALVDLVDNVVLGGGFLPPSAQPDAETLAFYTANTRFQFAPL